MGRIGGRQRLSPTVERSLEIFTIETGKQLLRRFQNVSGVLIGMIVGIQQREPVFTLLFRHRAEIPADAGAPTRIAVVAVVVGAKENPSHPHESGRTDPGLAENILNLAELVERE